MAIFFNNIFLEFLAIWGVIIVVILCFAIFLVVFFGICVYLDKKKDKDL